MYISFLFFCLLYLLSTEQIIYGSLNLLQKETLENILLLCLPSFNDTNFNDHHYVIKIKYKADYHGQLCYKWKNRTPDDKLNEDNTLVQVHLDYFLTTDIPYRRWFLNLGYISKKFYTVVQKIIKINDFFKYIPIEVIIKNDNQTEKPQNGQKIQGKCLGNITINGENEYSIQLQLFYNTSHRTDSSDPLLLWWTCTIRLLPTSMLAPLIKKIENTNDNLLVLQSEYYRPGTCERSTYLEWLSNIKHKENNLTIPAIYFYNKDKQYSPTLPLLLKCMEWDPAKMNGETYYGETTFPAAPFIKKIKHTISISSPLEFISLCCLDHIFTSDRVTIDLLNILNTILENNKPTCSSEEIKKQTDYYTSICKDEYTKVRNPNFDRKSLENALENLTKLQQATAFYNLVSKKNSLMENNRQPINTMNPINNEIVRHNTINDQYTKNINHNYLDQKPLETALGNLETALGNLETALDNLTKLKNEIVERNTINNEKIERDRLQYKKITFYLIGCITLYLIFEFRKSLKKYVM